MPENDMEIYKVGGAVRDRIMNRTAKDSDYVVLGTNEEKFLARYPMAKPVGKKKAVYILGCDEYTLSHSKNLGEDLESRDLTINSLAEDSDGKIIAHPLAFKDIENRILRPVRQDNFLNDPLRVFRAARFYAELPEFSFSGDLIETMKIIGACGKLTDLAPERVGREVLKAFASPVPSRFLKLLLLADCLEPWLEEVKKFTFIPAGPKPFHHGSLFDHICDVMDKLAGDPLLVWMGFCHDLGKSVTDEKILPHHYGHEKAGVKIAENIGNRLRLPQKYIKAGMSASLWHMKAGQYSCLRPGTRIDMLMSLLREDIFEEVFLLSHADRQSDNLYLAEKDLKAMMEVELPHEFRNLGEKSGSKLRELRCQAISINTTQDKKVTK